MPFKLSGTVTFLTVPRRWNMCSDGSAIPEHGERHSKNTWASILAALSPNINLSTNMALEVTSEHLILKKISGGACPHTPLVRACLCMHHHQCPPPLNRKYLLPPMLLASIQNLRQERTSSIQEQTSSIQEQTSSIQDQSNRVLHQYVTHNVVIRTGSA